MNDIAKRTAVRRAVRGFIGGMNAELRDEVGGIGRCPAIWQVDVIGQRFPRIL